MTTGHHRTILATCTAAAAALALALGGALAAHADVETGTSTLAGSVSGLTGDSEDGVSVELYDLDGHLVSIAGVGTDGRFSADELAAGAYKVGLNFNSRNLGGDETFGKHDVSSFFSTAGPTRSWVQASTVTLSDATTTTVSLRAVGGMRVTGTVIGDFVNGVKLCITAADAPPRDAFNNACVGLAKVTKYAKAGRTKYGVKLAATFVSTSLLPGRYKVWADTLGPVSERKYYWTGSKRTVTTTWSRAKTITVSRTTGSVSIGTFDATRR